MIKLPSSQRGAIGAVEIALIVVLLAAGGFTAWRITQADKTVSETSANSSAASESPQTTAKNDSGNHEDDDDHSGKVVISQFSVQFKPVAGLSGLKYEIRNTSVGKVADFTSSALEKLDAQCDAGALGLVGHGTGTYPSEPATPENFRGALLKQFDDFYVTYSSPQAACSDDEDAQRLQQDLIAKLRESLKSIELSN